MQCVVAGSSWRKGVGDKGSSRGGRVKGWYARNAMICEPFIAKALISFKPKASCQQELAKNIIYNRHQPRGFILQSIQVASSKVRIPGAFSIQTDLLGFDLSECEKEKCVRLSRNSTYPFLTYPL